MQVLNYQNPPIAHDGIQLPHTVKNIQLIQQQIKEPIKELFNSTLEAINETLQKVVDKVDVQKSIDSLSQPHDFEEDWNFLYFIRLFFYLIVILKIIELVFSKRRKIDIKERVYRKYVFSHAEMIRQFNEDDRKNMEMTLKNTIKNASMENNRPKMIKKNSNKKVMFHETKNEYFESKREAQNNVGWAALQDFLSNSGKVEPMQRSPVQESQQREFEVIETIAESKQINESGIFFEKQKTDSSLTSSTLENSIVQPQNSKTNQQVIEAKQKDE